MKNICEKGKKKLSLKLVFWVYKRYLMLYFNIILINCGGNIEMEQSKKREKFVSLAEKRVTKTIKDLRLIGNLSNKTNYSYDEQDVKKIVGALENEVRNIKKQFESDKESQEVVFKLQS